jgi:hypothetical protein
MAETPAEGFDGHGLKRKNASGACETIGILGVAWKYDASPYLRLRAAQPYHCNVQRWALPVRVPGILIICTIAAKQRHTASILHNSHDMQMDTVAL